jgi:mannose-6-phosphate isomerase
MKLLAAERPLSLQAHPDAQRAAIQHAAGNPNYTDGYHKPELLVALEPFEVLSGFRHPAASAHLLARVPALADVVELLRRGDLRAATIALLSASVRLIDDVLADTLSLMPQQHDLLQRLTEHHPRDPGALVALLLNHQVLNPGEAVYTPAGNLHAYVRGFGVEIMAASDNVLRAGLTTKIVDIPELLEVVRFEPLANPVVAAEPINADLVHWPAPVPEFSLHKACVDTHTPSVELPGNGPRIVVCTRGQVKVNGLTLSQGDTAYARATEPAISVSGNGHVFQASPG